MLIIFTILFIIVNEAYFCARTYSNIRKKDSMELLWLRIYYEVPLLKVRII